MKALVTGGRGMLGVDVCTAFADAGHDVTPCGSAEFDITDAGAAERFIVESRPDLIVHCAAYTDVDGCERDPERAELVNGIGAGNVAAAAQAAGARIIAISTDYVFDGRKNGAYIESDEVAPLGAYGKSKLSGEELVRAACSQHQIVRTAWLFGPAGRSFAKTILGAARCGQNLRVVADQIGSPTYTSDLAAALVELAGVSQTGVFHLTNSGSCSWHEFAVELLCAAGIAGVEVAPIRSEDWPTLTARPKNSVLRASVWEKLGKPPLRDWREAVSDFVRLTTG